MDILSGIVNEGANDRIVAGVPPITGRLCLWIFPQVPQIVHHVPGTVDIQLPKVIAVVPSFHIFGVVGLVCVAQNLVYLFLRKAKVLVQMCRRNGIRHKIVSAGEDALFRDAQATCNDGKAHRVIVFQRCTQHSTDNFQHLCIIPVGAGFGDGHVILIEQQDHRLAIVSPHQLHQQCNRRFQHRICGVAADLVR